MGPLEGGALDALVGGVGEQRVAGAEVAGGDAGCREAGDVGPAELRPHGIRVISLCPSEVQTNFDGKTGRNNPNKLFAEDIAGAIMAALAMPRRALWTELTVFASNPWKEG